MPDNAEREAPEIPLYLTPEQIRYVLRLVGPIVSDLAESQYEDSVARQIERALDSVLCNWDEDHPEDEVIQGADWRPIVATGYAASQAFPPPEMQHNDGKR